MTAAFFLGQDVNFSLKVLVGLHGAGLDDHLAAFDVFLLQAAEEQANVVTGLAFVKQLAEHFDVRNGGLLGVLDADDFDFFHLLDDAAFDTAGSHGAAAGDGEHVFHGHEEGLVHGAFGLRDVGVNGSHEFHDGVFSGGVAFQSLNGGTLDDGGVVAREFVFVEKFADFHFHEFDQVGVVNQVALVHVNDDGGDAHLAGKEDVFAGLRHRAVGSGNHEDGAVHLGSSGDHVLHIVGVSGAVNVGIVTVFRFVFNVGRGDGNAAFAFFGSGVDLVIAACFGETLLSEH